MIRTLGLLTAAVSGAIAISTAAPTLAAPLPQAPYQNCTQAKNNGDCDIPSSSDKYQPKLDRDGDGIGCECRRAYAAAGVSVPDFHKSTYNPYRNWHPHNRPVNTPQ